jgi:NAD(P) transhydrogenase subunit alpha
MAVTIGVPRERTPGETRVALVPSVARRYLERGARVVLEARAGQLSHFRDVDYEGVEVVDDPVAVFAADVVLVVNPPTPEQVGLLRPGAVVVGLLRPHEALATVAALRDRGVTSFALELLPRISRAQAMDALTSQGSLAGYKAVLMAACLAGRYFPMLTTPAGTLPPARVVVLGVGVAGLQAIATARRLGAVVEAHDVRAATREQVQSLGARFIETGIDAEAEGGYARELTPEERERARAAVEERLVAADVVITTAAVPGRPAPRLVSAEAVGRMKSGAVIIDLAAASGGNCELTRPGEQYETENGVFIYGPLNVPAMLPVHASDQYAHNLFHFLAPHLRDGELRLDWEDEVVTASLLTRDGAVVPAAVAERVAAWERGRRGHGDEAPPGGGDGAGAGAAAPGGGGGT